MSGPADGHSFEAETAQPRAWWAWIPVFVVGLAAGLVIGFAIAPGAAPLAPPPAPPKPAKPAQTSQIDPSRALLAKVAASPRPLTVGVFGDSMADGLWAGLYRQLNGPKTFQVVRFSQVSTGLSRYDYVDIQAKTQGQLTERHVDVAVVLFGTNDIQGIVDQGQIYPFGSDGWRQIYAARIDALVGLLRQQGAVVYWVGLPKMKRSHFDQGITLINSIAESRMKALNVPYLATVGRTVDASGEYQDYLPAEGSGKPQLLRAQDGIHMSMAGYLRIAAPVSGRIVADLAAAAPPKPPSGAASVSTVAYSAPPR